MRSLWLGVQRAYLKAQPDDGLSVCQTGSTDAQGHLTKAGDQFVNHQNGGNSFVSLVCMIVEKHALHS